MGIFERFFGTRPVPQRQASDQNVAASSPIDHYQGSRRPDAPPVVDTRSRQGGFTASAQSSKDLPYGSSPSVRENAAWSSADAHAASAAGDVKPKAQAADDGRLMRERGRR